MAIQSESIPRVQFYESETHLYRQSASGWEILSARGEWVASTGPGADMGLASDEQVWLHARALTGSSESALKVLSWDRAPYVRPSRLAPPSVVAEVSAEVAESLAASGSQPTDPDHHDALWDEVERRLAARGYAVHP